MNTILLQKILDLLKDNLTGVGTFIKSVFVHDPQDNQILSYDAEIGKWVNKDATEVELDLTNTFEAQPIATLPDSANNVPMKSLSVNIVPKETGTGTKSPSNPYVISGSDEVVITHTGKNLWSYGDISGTFRRYFAVDIQSGTYNMSCVVTSSDTHGTKSLVSFVYDDDTTNFVRFDRNTRQNASITLAQHVKQIYFYAGYNYDQSSGDTFSYNDIQLEAGSTATAYEPYTATTHTIALGQTVYGGEVDVISGQGQITSGYIESYDGETINEPWISSMDVYTPGGTPTTGAQVVYPLTTPTPLSTTPTAIKTTGYDNVSADCGDVSGEYYTKTAESILALANITEDITSSITKNTTDFSDILLKVSQNNKVISIEIYSASTSSALIGTFLSNLPKPAMNSKVLLANTTIGEDGIIIGTLKTTGELEITTTGAKSFSGLITYVSK